MDKTMFKLSEPLEVKGLPTVTEVEIIPIRGKHMRHMKLDAITQSDILILIGKITGLTSVQMDEMLWTDIQRLFEAVTPFLENGRETGIKA